MDLKLDVTTNDLIIEENDLVLIGNKDAIRQHLEIRLRTFLGEWFLDRTVGVPYTQELFAAKIPNTTVIQTVVREEVEKTPGIISLDTIDVVVSKGQRRIDITIGVTSVEGNFEITVTSGV